MRACERCGCTGRVLRWDEGRTIVERCSRCGHFLGHAPLNPLTIAEADAHADAERRQLRLF